MGHIKRIFYHKKVELRVMKIVIDARQIEGNVRGMGFFLKNMLEALEKSSRDNEYILMLNHPDRLRGFRMAPNFKPCRIFAPVGLADILEIPLKVNFINPDIVWFPANNCSPFVRRSIKVISTICDVMFISQKYHFLSRQHLGSIYRRTFSQIAIRRADLINTISKTSADKIVQTFKIDAERIFVTYVGSIKKELPLFLEEGLTHENNYDLTREFIYTISGEATSKNLPKLIEAFNIIDDDRYCLIVTGVKNKKKFITRNKALDFRNVLFTSYISNAEKQLLIRKCKLFAFVSSEEGFGIPPAEAIMQNARLLLSDISVLREIYDGYGVFVDPCSAADIARGIIENLEKKEAKRYDKDALLKRLSWKSSANILLEKFKGLTTKELSRAQEA